jgi:hypothetical protein
VNAEKRRLAQSVLKETEMLSQEDLVYHRTRAQAELDLAYRAERQTVAAAHMRLASLHMERLKRQDEFCSGSGLGAGR